MPASGRGVKIRAMEPEPYGPLSRAGEILDSEEFDTLDRRVTAQGEVLKLMYEALTALADDLSRLRKGEPPPGAVAKY